MLYSIIRSNVIPSIYLYTTIHSPTQLSSLLFLCCCQWVNQGNQTKCHGQQGERILQNISDLGFPIYCVKGEFSRIFVGQGAIDTINQRSPGRNLQFEKFFIPLFSIFVNFKEHQKDRGVGKSEDDRSGGRHLSRLFPSNFLSIFIINISFL